MAKKIDELERPKIPGYIDMSKVNSAAGNIAAARDAINNLNYDTFKQGTQYGNLKKSYEQQGQAAMKDTLGQVAARTGGMASSYATSAANQSYNNYMQTLEDAARSMFNEEYARKKDAYNMAQQEYANAYGEYRDAKSDAWTEYDVQNRNFENDRTYNRQLERDQKSDKDAATVQAQDDVLAIWEAGGTPSPQLLQAAGWYDEATGGVNAIGAAYKSGIDEGITNKNTTDAQKVVADLWAVGGTPSSEQLIAAGYQDANGNWTTAGKDALANSSALGKMDMEYLLTSGDWTWGDWDRDGEVEGDNEDVTAKQFFSKSGGSEEAWKAWLDDYNQAEEDKTTKESQTKNTNRIDAMLKNGASLEDIEKEFGIGSDGKTWESVTGMSGDEWQTKQTGYRQGSYKFQDTSAGRSEIVNKFAESGNLSAADQDNFDYLYGDGAYETLTNSVNKFGNDLGYTLMQWKDAGYDPDFLNNYIDDWERRMMSDIPGISQPQLDDIIESQFPDVANWLLNPEDAEQYVGKYYLDGR